MSAAPFPILPSRALQDLGERVALSRRARGLTQRDLAHLAGVGAIEVCSHIEAKPRWALHTLHELVERVQLLDEHAPPRRAVCSMNEDEATSAGGERPKATIEDAGAL